MRQWKAKKADKILVESDYYIVIMNPNIHRKTWNAIKLLLTIAESQYAIYYDEEIITLELHPVSKEEFTLYDYNPN